MNDVISKGQKVRILVGKGLRDGEIVSIKQSELNPAIYDVAVSVPEMNCTVCLINQTAETLFKQMVVISAAPEEKKTEEFSFFEMYSEGEKVIIDGKEYQFVKAPPLCEECSNCDLLEKCNYQCDNGRGNLVLKLCNE